ncbi:unnamed protein product [Hymenolepis diminuta]|uniref:Uncharacterized protein n=1 Tax=Hymenolepis diminuta TaxID=6216 RepID=A0A564Z9W1_HYMDI|nr:unnamed protein product [Hymenolepis diminuta]
MKNRRRFRGLRCLHKKKGSGNKEDVRGASVPPIVICQTHDFPSQVEEQTSQNVAFYCPNAGNENVVKQNESNVALYITSGNGFTKTVEYLLSHGADAFFYNQDENRFPIDNAILSGNSETVALLASFGPIMQFEIPSNHLNAEMSFALLALGAKVNVTGSMHSKSR